MRHLQALAAPVAAAAVAVDAAVVVADVDAIWIPMP
jgi:hypothetical protein